MLSQNDIKDNVSTSLKELGLTDNEVNLYITSLLLGPTTISNLAKHLSINRPNIYKLIKKLGDYDLAQFSERNKYERNFMVKSPTIIRSLLNKKREQFRLYDSKLVNSMPDLLALYHQGEIPTQLKVISGEKEYIKILDQILDESKNQIQFFGSAEDFISFISWAKEREWMQKRIKQKIKIHSLLLPGKDAEAIQSKDSDQLRETRIITGLSPFITSFHLFANKLILWQPKAPLALLIEDEYFVQMMKSIFAYLWDSSKIK